MMIDMASINDLFKKREDIININPLVPPFYIRTVGTAAV